MFFSLLSQSETISVGLAAPVPRPVITREPAFVEAWSGQTGEGSKYICEQQIIGILDWPRFGEFVSNHQAERHAPSAWNGEPATDPLSGETEGRRGRTPQDFPVKTRIMAANSFCSFW